MTIIEDATSTEKAIVVVVVVNAEGAVCFDVIQLGWIVADCNVMLLYASLHTMDCLQRNGMLPYEYTRSARHASSPQHIHYHCTIPGRRMIPSRSLHEISNFLQAAGNTAGCCIRFSKGDYVCGGARIA